MYPLYKDIRTRLGAPKWIDGHGVPRYDDFTPHDAAEIYGDFVLVMEVKCQACGKIFKCVNSVAWYTMWIKSPGLEPTTENVMNRLFGWGDAPWHTHDGDEDDFDGQCAGTTMGTDYVARELWSKRNKAHEWEQLPIPEEYSVWP